MDSTSLAAALKLLLHSPNQDYVYDFIWRIIFLEKKNVNN